MPSSPDGCVGQIRAHFTGPGAVLLYCLHPHWKWWQLPPPSRPLVTFCATLLNLTATCHFMPPCPGPGAKLSSLASACCLSCISEPMLLPPCYFRGPSFLGDSGPHLSPIASSSALPSGCRALCMWLSSVCAGHLCQRTTALTRQGAQIGWNRRHDVYMTVLTKDGYHIFINHC